MYDRDSMSDEDMSQDGDQSRFGKSTVRSRYTQNKTGGLFVIDGLRDDHKSRDPHF